MDFAKATTTARKWALRIGLGGAALAVVGTGLYTAATLGFSYSRGERVGYVQKISLRGWVCKTWEGELAMVNVPGQPAQLWPFSVRSEATAKAIDALAGHRVSLHYEQHVGVPSKCFGDTEYFVTGVDKAD